MPGCMVSICLTVDETVGLFSKVTEPFYTPNSKVWEFQLPILTNTLYGYSSLF